VFYLGWQPRKRLVLCAWMAHSTWCSSARRWRDSAGSSGPLLGATVPPVGCGSDGGRRRFLVLEDSEVTPCTNDPV
jgi:hypothetical protein